jgi:hypothetical protein
VKGQSLFCVESKGIPRAQMPQLKGIPVEGTPASRKAADEKGEVDLTADFVKYLEQQGYTTEDAEEHAAYLRPTQNELNGAKVAGMVKWMQSGGNPNPPRRGLPERELGMIVSEDNYIVDGHHRWAATVGLDAEDNRLGNDKTIPITRVKGLDVISLIHYAVKFANDNGIPNAGFGQANPANA